MKTTIKDIADIANVSLSTVSRALNNSPLIKLETKAKIKEIAKELKFEFNAAARSLSSNKTGNIAVVYETHIGELGPSLYINQLFVELRSVLEEVEFDAIVLEAYNPKTGDSNIDRLLRQQKVDAFIIVHDHIEKEVYDNIKDSGIPFVQLHMLPRYVERTEVEHFFADNTEGGRIATEHLIDQGCKQILTILPPEVDYEEFANRTTGYKKALEDHGLEFRDEFVIPCEFSFAVGHEIFEKHLDLINKSDGIFFQTDIQAFAFLTIAKERGMNIPQDIKIIGYDDSPLCKAIVPNLTTIQQPKTRLAELACGRVIDLINKKDADVMSNVIVPPILVVRESS